MERQPCLPVKMNTLRLEVQRSEQQGLIPRGRMRVNVQAEFYVRVHPTKEAGSNVRTRAYIA